MIDYPHQISRLLDEYYALVRNTKDKLNLVLNGVESTENQKANEIELAEDQIKQYKTQYEILIHKKLEEVYKYSGKTSKKWLEENKNMISETLKTAIDESIQKP